MNGQATSNPVAATLAGSAIGYATRSDGFCRLSSPLRGLAALARVRESVGLGPAWPHPYAVPGGEWGKAPGVWAITRLRPSCLAR
jgi:hypothetical protein